MTDLTYWNQNGRHYALWQCLTGMFPMSGPVEDADKNPKLELLRQGGKAYYDLFNNGGFNYHREIDDVFDIQLDAELGEDGEPFDGDWDKFHEKTEPVMDWLIIDAALEQGLIESKALFVRFVPGPIQPATVIAEVFNVHREPVAELVKDSVAYEMFCRGIGVTPDASLTDIDTGEVYIISLGYTSVFDDVA